VADGMMQIGEVAERTGLSLRTIRYYQEVGLVVPSERSAGGFRLYSEPDVARLELVKHMKPLDFTLEEMRSLLLLLDQLAEGQDEAALTEVLERLAIFRASADSRVTILRDQLRSAMAFSERLHRELSRGRRKAATARAR
jgi:MerR family copper efflux transcriptional regulator